MFSDVSSDTPVSTAHARGSEVKGFTPAQVGQRTWFLAVEAIVVISLIGSFSLFQTIPARETPGEQLNSSHPRTTFAPRFSIPLEVLTTPLWTWDGRRFRF